MIPASNRVGLTSGAGDQPAARGLQGGPAADQGTKIMRIERRYTTAGQSPYAAIPFRSAVSEIKNPDGSVVFRLEGIEVPEAWSQVASDVLAQKYFRKAGVPADRAEDFRDAYRAIYLQRMTEAVLYPGLPDLLQEFRQAQQVPSDRYRRVILEARPCGCQFFQAEMGGQSRHGHRAGEASR